MRSRGRARLRYGECRHRTCRVRSSGASCHRGIQERSAEPLGKPLSKAGIAKAELLADTLSLLLEGARVSRQSVGIEGPSAHFIAIGEAVIAAFASEAQSRKRSSHRHGEGITIIPSRHRTRRMAVKHA